MRAAIYARYSTDMQSPESIADQFRICERLAQGFKFEVVARFSDAAISGGTSARPGYQDMLRAARRREFDAIVAEDTSRLWRSMAEQSPRLAELSDLGIVVVTADLDTRNESAGILGAVTGAMGEQYRKEIGRRTRRGLEGLARAKKSTGGRSFGYVSAAESKSKEREIDPAQAKLVREIFEMAAEGLSPRRIAAELNARGVPSPGASWKRSTRRSDSKWLASAIAGDVRKDSGLLNNPLYCGRVIWNRMKWIRSAADSTRRRAVLNPRAEWIEHRDERLRIISDALWDRVKARQAVRAHIGDKVKGGLRRRAGAGPPPKFILSELLRCGLCGAGFTMVNNQRYGCASHKGGNACSNNLTVARKLVESRILQSVKRDLLDPDVIREIESRVQRALKQRRKAKPDTGTEITRLQKEIANLADAVAGGLLKSSPVLAERLAAAETRLAGLQRTAAYAKEHVTVESMIVPRIAERCRGLVGRLEEALAKDPERGRIALRDIVGDEIKLAPDESGRFLWAEFGLESLSLVAKAANSSINLVAGARYDEPLSVELR
jgi:site-specific DNA recombinase